MTKKMVDSVIMDMTPEEELEYSDYCAKKQVKRQKAITDEPKREALYVRLKDFDKLPAKKQVELATALDLVKRHMARDDFDTAKNVADEAGL